MNSITVILTIACFILTVSCEQNNGEYIDRTEGFKRSIVSINSTDEDFNVTGRKYKRNAWAHAVKWAGGIIPYAFDSSSGFTSDERNRVINSMKIITRQTGGCLKFKERTSQNQYVVFKNLAGCWSYVWRVFQLQPISLQRGGCVTESVIIHEILHAAGINHEQCRSDRDDYVRIDYNKIEPSKVHNFDKTNTDPTSKSLAYDYYSVMHYGARSFGINNAITIYPYNNVDINLMGHRSHSRMSILDILKLKSFYGCSSSIQISLRNAQTRLRLESNATGNVYARSSNNGSSQKWNVKSAGDDTFNLINVATGRYLDSNHNGDVYTLPGNVGNHQKWRFIDQRRIVNVAFNRALDTKRNGTVNALPQNGGNSQNWIHWE